MSENRLLTLARAVGYAVIATIAAALMDSFVLNPGEDRGDVWAAVLCWTTLGYYVGRRSWMQER